MVQQRKSIRWVLIFGIWTLLGLLASSQIYFSSVVIGRNVPFVTAFIWQMSAHLVLAVSTPLVIWIARRYQIERRNWSRRLAFHLLASFLFSSMVTSVHIVIDLWFGRGVNGITLAAVSRLLLLSFDRVVFIYWTIVLLNHAYDYYTRYQDGLLRAAHLETRLAQAQLQALKMQLNPHFLFNTLNVITELIHKDPEVADEMITQLSDMLRSTLDKTGVQEVSLKQELEFLERYLAIERTRMGSRLQIEMHIAPETLDAQVPNMLLQPLVENAVKHGIAPCAAGGRVCVEAERHDGVLQLSVSDTGRGLGIDDMERRKNFGNGNGDSGVSKKGGVGLSNTRARLAHLYGAESRFEILPASPHGLTVCIRIPFREEGDSEHDTTDPNLDC
ncbi:MAG: histidine kinase [Pyrinomonadaceae bacterium MAG19_C2-C3]|nr:histidine kinase [Pyrinomonadaceae bacterium MAG19_C2-C3]